MSTAESAQRTPIVFIPGLAGSVLEAKFDKTAAAVWSKKTNEFQRVWFSFQEVSKPGCLADELALFYDESTGRYRNQTGVEIRAADFGGLGGIEALHPDLPRLTHMFGKLTRAFKDEGYQERKHLFGAPYDFRLAAEGLEQVGYFQQLEELIEQAVQSNDGRPATIVAHSLGCLVSLYFFKERSPTWLQRHVSGLVAISAPWGGAVSSLKGSISGDNFDAPIIPHNIFRPVQSSAPSGPWMFPSPDLWQDDVLVTTGSKKYTAKDVLELLQDLGLEQQAALYPRVHNLTHPLPKLDMRVHCLYGTGKATAERFEYDVPNFSGSEPPAPKRVVQGPGDGTVNLRSLESGVRLGDDVSLKSFDGASHMGLLTDQRLIDEVLHIVTGAKSRGRAGMLQRNWGYTSDLLSAAIGKGIRRLVAGSSGR